MAVYYAEFDTTVQNLIKDIKTKVLLNPDWSWQGLDTQIVTTSATAAVNATSVSITNGTLPAALQVGHVIRIGAYSGNHEYRVITSLAATSISFSNGQLVNSYPSGTPIFWGNEVLRTTTVRGAPMILDITGGTYNGEMARKVAAAAYNGFTPPTTTVAPVITGGSAYRSAYYRRGNASSLSAIVHVIVSTSKDHIFISVEGPRMSEPLPSTTTYGSNRGYVFMSDLVPYSPSDTVPTVVLGGQAPYDSDGGISNKSHIVNVSKSFDGAGSWIEAVPLALQYPTTLIGYTLSAQRMTSIDGTDKYYLSPYVIAANDCGLRGRLSSFFYAGSNSTTGSDTFNPTVGSEVIYNGVTYKLMAVSKSDGTGGSTYSFGSFGAVNNAGADFWQSPIVAVPMA